MPANNYVANSITGVRTLLTVGGGGGNWVLVGALETNSAIDDIGSVSVYAAVESAGVIATQYADSVELILVPRWGTIADGITMLSMASAIGDSVATAWLWGGGPVGSPFEAQGSWGRELRHVVSHTGLCAPRWEVWARSGQAAGATNQVTVVCKMVGRLGQSGGLCGEKINTQCTVPPFMPAKDALSNLGSIFPSCSKQNSSSPRRWSGNQVTSFVNSASTAAWAMAVIGGGPWKIHLTHQTTCLLNWILYPYSRTNWNDTVRPITNGSLTVVAGSSYQEARLGYQFNSAYPAYETSNFVLIACVPNNEVAVRAGTAWVDCWWG